MTIKPDMLCYLVNLLPGHKEFEGKVVRTMELISGPTRWVIDAAWLREEIPGKLLYTAVPHRLRPISDPDADLTADYPELLEDKLREVTA